MRNQYEEVDVARFIDHLVVAVATDFALTDPLNIVGIRTRGETLAERLATRLRDRGYRFIGRGVLDITLYRDDLSEIGPRPMVRPTHLDLDIKGNPLLLVADVLFTGRSILGAL